MDSSPIIRSDDLRSRNRHRLLDTLRNNGACNPAQLSELTGLSPASISTLSSQMIEQGILLSDKRPTTKPAISRGRPQSQLSLNPEAGVCATLNLAIDSIHAQRVNYAGEVCGSHELQLKTRDLSVNQIISTAISAIDEVCSTSGKQHLQHIGVAFQGMTEHSTGNLLWSPIIQHQNVPLSAALEKHFGVRVSVNNDCASIAQALSREQSSVLGDSFATILFSHGVGLGLYLDGKPFAGTRSSALELGHLNFEPNGALCRCGQRGCIEAYAADYGIERMAEGASIDDEPAGRVSPAKIDALVDDASSGDLAAIQAFTIAGAAIGEGLVSLFTLLDPMPVALVGLSKPGVELMRDGIQRTMKKQLRKQVSIEHLLFCFDDADPLVESGLIDNSLCSIDKQFAGAITDTFIHANA